jgi:hypothetical protein
MPLTKLAVTRPNSRESLFQGSRGPTSHERSDVTTPPGGHQLGWSPPAKGA